MKYYNIPICEAYNGIILEEVSNKILLQAKKYWVDIPENQFKPILDNFLTNIRAKLQAPQNDINFWFKKPFSEFKDFIENYKSKNQQKDEQKYNAQTTKDGGGKKIAENEEYELWQVDSYEAAKELGRFYKGYSTEWCISTDNPEHWGEYYYNNNQRFYFLIRKIKENNKLDKIAITVDAITDFNFWDKYDTPIDADKAEKIIKKFNYFKPFLKYYEFDNSKNNKDYTSYILNEKLLIACDGRKWEKVKTLIKMGANINAGHDYALREAAYSGNLSIIKYLIENGADIHTQKEQPLRTAVINGYFPVVKYLVEKGADINEDYVLRYAIYHSTIYIVKYLLEKGGTINKNNLEGYIRDSNSQEVKDFLIAKYVYKYK